MYPARRASFVIPAITSVALSLGGTCFAAEVVVDSPRCAVGAREVIVPVNLACEAEESVCGAQFDLLFDEGFLALKELTTGEAAQDAGKAVHVGRLASGRVRVIIAGLNQRPMASGRIALARFDVSSATVASGRLVLNEVILSDPFGHKIAVQTTSGEVLIADAPGESPEKAPAPETRGGCFGAISPPTSGGGRGDALAVLFVVAGLLLLGARAMRRCPCR